MITVYVYAIFFSRLLLCVIIILVFVDQNTGEEVTFTQADVTTQGNTVMFTSERLTENTRYRATVRAANINGSATSTVEKIS